MDIPSLETILGTGLGVGGGSVTVGWVAKYLLTRFIEKNDEKHKLSAKAIQKLADAHRVAYNQLSEKLSSINTDLAVIKSRMGEVLTVREDVKANTKDVAVALERIEANTQDIDAGFMSMRDQMKSTRQELSDLKRLKPM